MVLISVHASWSGRTGLDRIPGAGRTQARGLSRGLSQTAQGYSGRDQKEGEMVVFCIDRGGDRCRARGYGRVVRVEIVDVRSSSKAMAEKARAVASTLEKDARKRTDLSGWDEVVQSCARGIQPGKERGKRPLAQRARGGVGELPERAQSGTQGQASLSRTENARILAIGLKTEQRIYRYHFDFVLETYRNAFVEYGIHAEDGPIAESVKIIGSSKIRTTLTAVLDDWADRTPDTALASRLYAASPARATRTTATTHCDRPSKSATRPL